MKPILVLAPPQPGTPAHERPIVEVHRGMPESLEEFSAVVVVDDGGAGSARCLLEVLCQRATGRHPRIGVLSFLGGIGPQPRGDPLRTGRRYRRATKLRLGGGTDAPTIEYQLV